MTFHELFVPRFVFPFDGILYYRYLSRVIEKEFKIILFILLMFLAFFYGALAISLQLFPYKYIVSPIIAAETLQRAFSMEKYGDEIRWVEPLNAQTGVVVNKVDADDYILTATTHDSTVRLMDRNGDIRHSWTLKFNEAMEDQSHVLSVLPIEDHHVFPPDAHLYPNGDVIMMLQIGGVTPWGAGLVKLDKDSNVLWAYPTNTNSDFHVAPDGTIYIIQHVIREDKPESIDEIFLPFLEDNILQISADGKFIKQTSLIDAIDNSPFRALLKQTDDEGYGDPTHSNSIEYVRADHPTVPWLKEGYLLLSIRNWDALAILDPAKGEIVHVMELRARMQHDIDMLDNGNFLIFDNQGDFRGERNTRVIEFVPDTQDLTWIYDGSENGEELFSEFWGDQQRLDNGNTLIMNAQNGEMREVTVIGDIVWHYYTDLYKEIDGIKKAPTITHAEIYDRSYIQFDLNAN